jgi:hypothetical protein
MESYTLCRPPPAPRPPAPRGPPTPARPPTPRPPARGAPPAEGGKGEARGEEGGREAGEGKGGLFKYLREAQGPKLRLLDCKSFCFQDALRKHISNIGTREAFSGHPFERTPPPHRIRLVGGLAQEIAAINYKSLSRPSALHKVYGIHWDVASISEASVPANLF